MPFVQNPQILRLPLKQENFLWHRIARYTQDQSAQLQVAAQDHNQHHFAI